MAAMVELVHGGGVTSAKGFAAGGTYAGLKSAGPDVLDLGILVSERPASVAGTFSQNAILSGSTRLTRERAKRGTARGVVANSGCANCSVGEQGVTDAAEMAALAASHVGMAADEFLVCSTGVIGMEMPMALVRQNIGNVKVAREGGEGFARAIMTTDTHVKQMAVSFEAEGRRVVLGGAAKGAAMIHPNMATMLCFITTDAAVEPRFLQAALKEAVDASFNMIDVDGDQSTNDTVLVLANGAAGGAVIGGEGSPAAAALKEALAYVCTSLAKEIARDGEGSQRMIEVVVAGARTLADARLAARTIVSSILVKAMVHGRDPNWGRVMMALGKSGAELVESTIDLFINDIHVVHQGIAIPFFQEAVVTSMAAREIRFQVDLHLGDASATAWGCDLTEEYVTLNAAYTT